MNQSWMEKYKTFSDGRYKTFQKAFELLSERKGTVIVETGCVRLPDDWGGGMSTYLFGEYCKKFGSHLWTVDISPVNMECCRQVTKEFSPFIDYSVDDSLHFLEGFSQPIDLLYLDSMDVPLIEDPNDPGVLQSQNHQLREMTISLPKMKKEGIILLDDNQFKNGGKTKLTKLLLKSEGWTELIGEQQSLWVR